MELRPARLIAAGAIVGVGLIGGAVGVMALDDSGTPTKPPVKAAQVVGTEAPTTVAPSTTVAPVPTTVAPMPPAEPEPGQELSPPPMPAPGQTVAPADGPYGPVYPDGYVDPTTPTVTAPPVLPPARPADG